MCKALGYEVTRLKRIRVMNIELGKNETRRIFRDKKRRLRAFLRDSPKRKNDSLGSKRISMGSQENSKIEENSGLQEADKQDSIARMKELISFLNEASKAYYQEGREIVSNLEYDKAYDTLLSLEKESGVVLSGSPAKM